jgi:hypothetical protein
MLQPTVYSSHAIIMNHFNPISITITKKVVNKLVNILGLFIVLALSYVILSKWGILYFGLMSVFTLPLMIFLGLTLITDNETDKDTHLYLN